MLNKVAYFDNAATTFPKPECVYSFMDSFYREHGGNAGRGQYKLSAVASKMTEETRSLLQEILHCKNKDVFFSPSATIALNMIIQGTLDTIIENIKNSTVCTPTIYISPFEHNAVTRILHHYEVKNKVSVQKLFVTKDFCYDLEKIKNQFEKTPPNFVIISHASNVCGLLAPTLEIFSLAKKHGSLTLVDMAQTAALVPFDCTSDLIDFAVFAGHKTLYGPFGIGGFVKKQGLDLEPLLFGGTGVESAAQDMPKILPQRYEPGSQNIVAIAGLNAALMWWKESEKEIREKENSAHHKLVELLQRYSFIHIVGPKDRFSTKTRCTGVLSCVFENYSADEIGGVFDEKNIAIRTGLQCSPLAHKFLETFPAGTVRFSVGAFTGEEDFAQLESALEYIKENG